MKAMLNTVNRPLSSSVRERAKGSAFVIVAALLSLCGAVSSCGTYDPLPPKTEASTSYYLPDAASPTQTEIDLMKAEREEYNKATK